SDEHAVRSPIAKIATTNFFMAISCRIWGGKLHRHCTGQHYGFLFGATAAGTRKYNGPRRNGGRGERPGREVDAVADSRAPLSHLFPHQQRTGEMYRELQAAGNTRQPAASCRQVAG